jgi:hydroxyethylthiazole kinase-like uncharacterized protein yjeF
LGRLWRENGPIAEGLCSLRTLSSTEVRVLTAAEMQGHERAAIAARRVTGSGMMMRAGRGVADAVATRWRPGKVAVLCGPGNNGGDGYVVARLLAERGWEVSCCAFGAPPASPDAAAAREAWEHRATVAGWDGAAAAAGGADLVVDAVFGAGLTRPAPAEVLDAIGAGPPAVAVDAPTGLCMDSGRPLGGRAARAALTVTFHAPRLGHYLAEGPAHCGSVVTVDIGLAPFEGGVPLVQGPLVALGKGAGHKYDSGHALILSGGPGRGGAARMAARAALRVGAGLVTLGCPPAAQQENAGALDAVMLRPVADAAALPALLGNARINAVGLGPGLGMGEGTRALVAAVLASGRGAVLDADAITAIAQAPDDLLRDLHSGCLLTPHDGEFARLFPDIAERLAAPAEAGPAMSRLDAAREAAARAGCVVLVKGPDTVIAAPDGRAALHAAVYDRAAPWLATAGAGDVLTGLCAGLMARGAPAFEAAATATWLHAEAARRFGPGLIAEDLPDALPAVFRDLGL